mmetsp:Transcript_21165/g.59230  ORF Transcript_21165/g.59230 Transcript_21165/m.59230 type:complete len:219 (-) Transcript_21165:47-703(-)
MKVDVGLERLANEVLIIFRDVSQQSLRARRLHDQTGSRCTYSHARVDQVPLRKHHLLVQAELLEVDPRQGENDDVRFIGRYSIRGKSGSDCCRAWMLPDERAITPIIASLEHSVHLVVDDHRSCAPHNEKEFLSHLPLGHERVPCRHAHHLHGASHPGDIVLRELLSEERHVREELDDVLHLRTLVHGREFPSSEKRIKATACHLTCYGVPASAGRPF